ncbi:MAG TPA: hypothetical protein ENJ42_00875 [Hellea balneolensis]|uniref:SseB protein N-terminal domain-containing protein n=1 Tax=Hellea balneolensis TaxID=287478 RepID=A0A7C5R7K8_9PROT|nr:hypothetical protein [Hellea balneolensis]
MIENIGIKMPDEPKDQLAQMLEQASPEMMTSDPIVRKAFSVALLASDLFVPVYENETEQAQAGGVSLQAVNIDDKPHILLFSSKEKLGEFMERGTRYACAPGTDIIPSICTSYAVLNPGPTGRQLTPADFAEILGDKAPAHGQPGHVHGPNCSHD